MICYILNKYNANKTVEFSGHWSRVLWLMENAGFNKSNAKVTIETLHDPEGPLNAEEGKGWFAQWDGHWGEVMKETKNLNLDKEFTHTIPPLSFVSFRFFN